MSGSVEAACGLGLADAVVDLVETGTTMRVSIYHIFIHIAGLIANYRLGCRTRNCR